MTVKRNYLLITIALLMTMPAHAKDGTRVSVGAYASSGDYGRDETTELSSLMLSIRQTSGPWKFKASTSYLSVKSDGAVLPDGEDSGSTEARRTRSGVGDLNLSVSRLLLFEKSKGYGLRSRAKIKVPTASHEKALGTGEVDYTVELAPFFVSKSTTYFGALGYLVKGDTEDTDYNNMWFVRLGAQAKINKHNSLGGRFLYRQPTSDDREAKRNLMAFHTYQFNPSLSVQSFAIKGLSDSSADVAGGLSFRRDF